MLAGSGVKLCAACGCVCQTWVRVSAGGWARTSGAGGLWQVKTPHMVRLTNAILHTVEVV